MGGSGFIQQGNPDWSAPAAVGGSHIGFVQGQGQVQQTFTAPASGNLTVTLWLAGRVANPGYYDGNQDVTVSVNGSPVARYSTTSGSLFHKVISSSFALTAGQSCSLQIAGGQASDSTAFVDEVRLVPAGSTTAYSYDALGRLTQATVTGGGNDGLSSSYTLDPAGNRTGAHVSSAHP